VGQPILAAAGFQPATAAPKSRLMRLLARLPAPQKVQNAVIGKTGPYCAVDTTRESTWNFL